MSFSYSSRDILERARGGGYAIGAFNVANIETLKAVVQAADKLRSPVIIESSPGETKYIGAENLVDFANNYQEQYRLPILVNLDHALDEKAAKEGIAAGYDLIHIDVGELPSEKKVAVTQKVVSLAHAKNLLVEGELDHIEGSSKLHDEGIASIQDKVNYTDPESAADFVKQTGVDIFASFIGNVHGVYKTAPRLDIERLKLIARKINCFLSLHGGSGIPDNQIKMAIRAGIVKINVNTEMRLIFKQVMLKSLQETDELAIYKITPLAIEAVQKIVEAKIRLFGSEGKV